MKKIFLLGLVFFLPLLTFAEESKEETESVCISCHRGLEGKAAEPVALWEKSYHKKMGNACEGCHGGDPADMAEAMSADKGFVGSPKPEKVAAFCGKCHVGVLENYSKSPHALAPDGKGPNCVTCHQSHAIQKASFDLIQPELCGRCHTFENAQKIKRSFVSAEMALRKADENIHYWSRRGMQAKRLEEKLFVVRNSLHQMTHTLDISDIEVTSGQAIKELDELDKIIDDFKKKIHRRWLGGILVGVFLGALIFVLIRLLKTYEDEA